MIRLAIGVCVCWSSVAIAQPVLLRVHPPVGDTIRMKMEQRFEMTPLDSGSAQAKPMTATMRVRTRAIVLSATNQSAELLSIIDSVTVTPAAAAAIPQLAKTVSVFKGKQVRLRVATDGGMTLTEGRADAQPVLGVIPAVLPAKPVAKGDSWVRDLPVPLSATSSARGLVHVTFTLDSLGPDGAIAYLSMRGTVEHEQPPQKDGPRSKTTGTISGTMQIDRRLEWITDSHMTVTLTTTMTVRGGTPQRVRVKVTQWLRAIPRT